MAKKLFSLTSSLILLLILLGLGLVAFLPKYFLTESLLSKEGVFILSRKVEEGFDRLRYFEGFISLDGKKIANFTLAEGKLLPLPAVRVVCPSGGVLSVSYSPPAAANAEARNFDCSYSARRVEGKLQILRREIFGKLSAEGVKLEGVPLKELEKVELHFEGRRFRGTIRAMGTTFTGGGSFRWDMLHPEETHIDATFRGSGMVISIRGNILNPSVSVR